jgi:hypothetical protein
MARAVADTRPLIALNQIRQLGLLGHLFEIVRIASGGGG